MLPLGLRVQEKIERLIDKHMCSVGKYVYRYSCPVLTISRRI